MIDNSIKLLALDLDGTLTASNKEVSEENREAIFRAIDNGVSIVLASGRPVIGISAIADCLELAKRGGYILAYNGGQIIDCRNNCDIVKKTIPLEYNHLICEISKGFAVYPLSYNEYGVICEDDSNRFVQKEAYNNGLPIIRVDSLENEITESVVKYMVVGEPTELKKVEKYLDSIIDNKLNIFYSEPYFMEITPKGIEKASGLSMLAEQLGIKRESVCAVGDGLNDIPMLEYAGTSIAVENAYDEVKACADYVVASNEDNGVAEAIYRFVLNKGNLR